MVEKDVKDLMPVFQVVATQTSPAIKLGDEFVSVEEMLVKIFERLVFLERIIGGK